MRVRLGYPTVSEEIEIFERQQMRHPIESLEAVVEVKELLEAMEAIKKVYISAAVKKYVLDLVTHTRENQDVYLGVSPRGSLTLFRTGQAKAAMEGRDFVLPDDVKKLAVSVLAHRVIVAPSARLRELSAERIVHEILDNTPVPGGDYDVSRKS